VGAVALLVRRDLRSRWRSVVLLCILVGIVGAMTLSTVAGARRTSTALSRFEASSRAADLEFATSANDHEIRALAQIPGVGGLATLRAFGVIIRDAPDFQQIGAPVDDQFGASVDRARIVAGRAPDPSAVDEITIGEGLAARLHTGVGRHLDVVSFSPDQTASILQGASDTGPPAGPRVRLSIVGVVRSPLDLGENGATGGLLVLTPAFRDEYEGRIGVFGNRIRIRVDGDATDTTRVLAASRTILGDSLFTAQGLAVESQGANGAIDVLARALWIVAALAALAGAVTIGIVLSREISRVAIDQEALRALGCTRRARVLAALLPASAVLVGGACLAALGAVAASPVFPLGVARRADPSVGVHTDWVVLALGIAALAAIVASIAWIAALRATRSVRAGFDTLAKGSSVVRVAFAMGLSPPATSGMRLALEPGHGGSSVPVRSAFFGAILGVLGVAAVLVFAANLDHLAEGPRLYGATWGFAVDDTTANTPCGAGDFGLHAVAGVASVTELCSQNVRIVGRPVPALAYTRRHGAAVGPTVLSGRAPRGAREIALGSKTLEASGHHIGDTVRVSSLDVTREYRIVGRVVMPTLGKSQPLGDGAMFTGAGYAPLFQKNLFTRTFVGQFTSGTSRRDVERRIGAIPEMGRPSVPRVPVQIDRLSQIRWLPVSLTILFGGLALLAVGHALVTGVRRRRREFALFKTLGFTTRQVRATVAWQATTLVVVGLLIGLPLGVIAGEFAWRIVADGLGVGGSRIVPVPALVGVGVAACVTVNLVAAFPARAAARLRPAAVLRSE